MQQAAGGPDKLAVLLLSVDPEYFQSKAEKYAPLAEKIYQRMKLDWPNVWVPGGWGEMMRVLNATGYGKILVDAHGVVRGLNLHGKELEQRVREVVGGTPAEKGR